MKRIIAVIFLCIVAMLILAGCSNIQFMDTTFKFNKAIIVLSDGTRIEGTVQSWLDYEDSDTIQVKINNISYYTSSHNVLLIAE